MLPEFQKILEKLTSMQGCRNGPSQRPLKAQKEHCLEYSRKNYLKFSNLLTVPKIPEATVLFSLGKVKTSLVLI